MNQIVPEDPSTVINVAETSISVISTPSVVQPGPILLSIGAEPVVVVVDHSSDPEELISSAADIIHRR